MLTLKALTLALTDVRKQAVTGLGLAPRLAGALTLAGSPCWRSPC
jgi:hypothetical protein